MNPEFIQIDGVQKHEQALIHDIQNLINTGYSKYSLENIPIYVEVCKKNNSIITPYGIDTLGDRPYAYATARRKDNDKRLCICYISREKKYIDDGIYHLASCLGDICSIQYEKYIGTDVLVKDNIDDYVEVRTGLAVCLANKMLCEISIDKALRKEHMYTMGSNPIDKVLNEVPFPINDKIGFITQLIGYNLAVGKTIDDCWNTSSFLCEEAHKLEKLLVPIYIKILNEENVNDDELNEVFKQIKEIKSLLYYKGEV